MEAKKREEASNDCGGFRPPKGHLDTQMYPECKGTETDRNIVKKTVEKRKNKKNKKKASKEVLAKHGWPIVREKSHQKEGIWEQWINNRIDDKKFVMLMNQLHKMNYPGVSLDPNVRRAITISLQNVSQNKDYENAASNISAALATGKMVNEDIIREQMQSGEIEAEHPLESELLSNHDIRLIEARRKMKNELLTSVDLKLIREAKKKKKKSKDWDPNPWAVCTESIGGKEGTTERSEWDDDAKDRYERCVKKVKKQQAFNLKNYFKNS